MPKLKTKDSDAVIEMDRDMKESYGAMMTIANIAEYLGVSRDTVYRFLSSQNLRPLQLTGKGVHYRTLEIARALEKSRIA